VEHGGAATVEEQRAAILEARQELAATLKEFRALTDKHLKLSETGGN
jgi:hypothetical protein